MRAPEPLRGTRVVAAPAVLDGVAVGADVPALRLADDDLLLIGAADPEVADPHAIVEAETGFVGWWLTDDELRNAVLPHVDWTLPDHRPALAQGLVAGVPAKVWCGPDRTLLLCAAAYAHELQDRLP